MQLVQGNLNAWKNIKSLYLASEQMATCSKIIEIYKNIFHEMFPTHNKLPQNNGGVKKLKIIQKYLEAGAYDPSSDTIRFL